MDSFLELPRLLDSPTRFYFFTGKGGVGKTSLSSATAVRLADSGRRVLLVSTDPASNLDEVLGTEIGTTRLTGQPKEIPGVPGLFGVNIDPSAAAEEYRERLIGPVRDHLPESAIQSMEEQLSGACTVEIAAFDEFSRWIGNPAATEEFDHVIFDTAPTGHTLRLLRLPAAWSGFLEENTSGHSCLGPVSGLVQQRTIYETALRCLTDPGATSLVLVSRPDIASLQEAERASRELADLGLSNQNLVVNGLFARADDVHDPAAQSLARRQGEALGQFEEFLRHVTTYGAALRRTNLIGLEALREVYAETPGESLPGPAPDPTSVPAFFSPIEELIEELASAEGGIVMTMGKGGVGKTTVACSLALELSQRGKQVCLTTTDPAAHLETTLAGEAGSLRVERIDPARETEAYVREVMETQGRELDEAGRSLLEEDLRSPCTEEVAVFRAFARTVERARDELVVLDTAPTGHTLLLLDATEAYHREVSRKDSRSVPECVSELLPRLRDPEFTRVTIVTVPESTPVHEASVLQDDLVRAGITPWAWIVNQSWLPVETDDPLLAERARRELPLLEEVGEIRGRKACLLPWSPRDLDGADALRALLGEREAALS